MSPPGAMMQPYWIPQMGQIICSGFMIFKDKKKRQPDANWQECDYRVEHINTFIQEAMFAQPWNVRNKCLFFFHDVQWLDSINNLRWMFGTDESLAGYIFSNAVECKI